MTKVKRPSGRQIKTIVLTHNGIARAHMRVGKAKKSHANGRKTHPPRSNQSRFPFARTLAFSIYYPKSPNI
jgi:hypothetical protein